MRSSRGSDGVRLRGEVGELWANGSKVGLVYRWLLEGWNRDWRLEADRYKLDPSLLVDGQRNIELVLDIRIGILRASGAIWTEYVADDRSHRAMIIKGTAMGWHKQQAAPAKEK